MDANIEDPLADESGVIGQAEESFADQSGDQAYDQGSLQLDRGVIEVAPFCWTRERQT
jgi:hypothetical protein